MKLFIKNKRYLLFIVGVLLFGLAYIIQNAQVNMYRADDECLLEYGDNYEKRGACWNLKFSELYDSKVRNGTLVGIPGYVLVGLSIYGIYLKKTSKSKKNIDMES